MADLTLLANWIASSSSCHLGIMKYMKSKPTCSQAQLHDTHLLMHSGHVPHVAHDGPAGHHPQQVADHAVLGAVPESISKLWVILKIKKTTTLKCWGKTEWKKVSQVWWNYRTFMATGYMVAPISKLPFLNIMTDVLLMQVPEKRPEARWGHVSRRVSQRSGSGAKLRVDLFIGESWDKTNELVQLASCLPSGNINIGSFVLSFTWSFNLWATRRKNSLNERQRTLSWILLEQLPKINCFKN